MLAMVLTAVVRAAQLGFVPEPEAAGPVFVRRETIDLSPWLDALEAAPAAAGTAVLDIEAVGIATGHLAAFLVGVGRCRGSDLALEQFLLADVSAELALLEAVAGRVRPATLVTYNGRAFDMRVLASRCVANGLHPAVLEPQRHHDLLAPARRHFRGRLRSCTLAEIETAVLGVFRGDDVLGREGPVRYRAWLRGAPADVLAGVVAHNAMDVASTALLEAHMTALGEPPATPRPPVRTPRSLAADRA